MKSEDEFDVLKILNTVALISIAVILGVMLPAIAESEKISYTENIILPENFTFQLAVDESMMKFMDRVEQIKSNETT